MRWQTLLIVAVAVLAISAQPVAAQNASEVASQHTTFGTAAGEPSPTTLSGARVVGSGESASVTASSESIINPIDRATSDNATRAIAGTTTTGDPYKSEIRFEPSSDATLSELELNIQNALGSDYGATVTVRIVEEAPDGDYGEGTQIATWDPDWSETRQQISVTEHPVDAGQTYTIEFITQSVSGTGDAERLQINVAGTADSNWFSRSGQLSSNYPDMNVTLIQKLTTARYVGAAHDAEAVEQGWTNLTLSNADATVTWQADPDDDGVWTNVTSTTVSSTTNLTQDLSGTQSDRWRVRVDFEATGANPVAELHDEGVLFEPATPTVSDLDPPDEAQISDYQINVSATVTDADFDLTQGDSATVTAESDGQTINSTTISSNQTVSFPYDAVAGSNTVTWTVTDTYGRTTTTTQTFSTPAELRVVDELNQTLIDDVTITVQYYGQATQDPIIEDRTISDGTADLSGLPGDQPLIVVVDAPGYVPRRIYISSYYNQRTIYLLPDSADRVNKEFVLNDFTGRYDTEETILQIQRPLNGSWQTVQGDYFGSGGTVSAQLRYNARHRLVVRNSETGDERIFRGFTPLSSGEQPIRITADSTIVVREGAPSVVVEPSARTLAAQNETVTVGVEERSASITNLSATVVYRNNTTTETLTTVSSDGSDLSPAVNLSGRSGGTLSVSVTYQTADGVAGGQVVEFGISRLYDNPSSLLNVLGSITATIPGERATESFQAAVAILLTVILTAAFAGEVRASTEIIGAVALFLLGGWAIIGWLSYNIVFAGALGWIGVTALRRGL